MAGMIRPQGISACLLGLACRYDGCALAPDRRPDLSSVNGRVPMCPEQLGGLSTPRIPAEIQGGDGHDVLDGRARVVNRAGEDVSSAFLRGAQEPLYLCLGLGIEEVILKANSPSCGVHRIYSGEDLVDGCGVTAALLTRHGIVVSER